MGLLQDLEQRLLNKIKQLLSPVLTPLGKLWDILKGMFTAIIEVVPETISLVRLIVSEVQAWKTFRQGISFSSGVINLQSAKDRIESLVQECIDAFNAAVEICKHGLTGSVKPFEAAGEAAEELANLFDGLGELGLTEFVEKVGDTLKRAGGKIFEVLAIVQAIAEQLLQLVREISAIVTAAKDIRETFQTGEGLFLQQKNKRQVLTLDDGSKIKIRLGNLH